MDALTRNHDSVTEFLALSSKLLSGISVLVTRIREGNRRTAAQAARVLKALAPHMTPRQCAKVIADLFDQLPTPAQARNICIVFSALPRDIPEKAREKYFWGLLTCMSCGDEKTCRMAGRALHVRIAQATDGALIELMQIASKMLSKRRNSEDNRCFALGLLFAAQNENANRKNRTNIGLKLILVHMQHPNNRVRGLAHSALLNLAPMLPRLFSQDVFLLMRGILRLKPEKLTPKLKERAEKAKLMLLHALQRSGKYFEPLAEDILRCVLAERYGASSFRDLAVESFRPHWSTAGFSIGSPPPFKKIWPLLRKGFLSEDDITPQMCALIVSRYGPEARCRVAEMCALFKEKYRECCIAAPLLWAIMNAAIGTNTGVKLLAWLRKQEHACPHAVELEYLIRCRRPKPESRFMRNIRKKIRAKANKR